MTNLTSHAAPATASLTERWSNAIMGTYAAPTLALVRGDGATVWDEAGRAYLDLVGGIAVSALGHAHPAVTAAVTRQIATLAHSSNLYANEPSVALAERLLCLLGHDGKVFFCNSGAEANEAAFKLTRRTGRSEVVAIEGAFHGRTMGALSLTGQPGKRAPFEPLVPGVVHVPFGDLEAMRTAVTDRTAAVVVEPILGEAGVLPAPPGYLSALRDITASAGALLVLDEVQTGIGRTGAWFAWQREGVVPDVVTLAKGLAGGLPIGACVALGDSAGLLEPGMHGTTFGGNPVACAAALAVLDTVETADLCGNAERVGAHLRAAIERLDSPLVAGTRGAGLMIGIVLTAPVAKVAESSLRQAGFLVNACAPDVVRLVPPLVLTTEQADSFVAALPEALAAAASDGGGP